MKRFSFLCSVVLLISFSQSALALGMSGKDIIKKVKQRYQTLKTLQANFEQVFHWELAGETQTVKGAISLMNGNHYRIRTGSQEIVTDGETVWTYSKKDGQVIIDRLGHANEGQLPKDLLFRYSEDYKPKLLREEKRDGHRIYVLALIPNDEEAFIKSMKIWVNGDTWLTGRIEQVDINDNVNTYIISNIQDDIDLSPDVFQFKIPKDAEVVDLRESE